MEQIQGRNVEEPLLKVDYLDLTIQLENGHFVTQSIKKRSIYISISLQTRLTLDGQLEE